MYCGMSRYVKVINEDGASVTTKVAVKQALLHTYHSEAQTVVPIQRNSEADEVAQGREM